MKLEENFLEGEFDVRRRERLPIVPLHPVTQAEPVDRAALLDLPALGQLRDRITALVASDQPVVEQLGCGVGGPASRDRGIQVTWVRHDRHDERAASYRRVLGSGRCCAQRPHEQEHRARPVPSCDGDAWNLRAAVRGTELAAKNRSMPGKKRGEQASIPRLPAAEKVIQDPAELAAAPRQRVLDPGRCFRMNRPFDQSCLLEIG